MKERGSQTQVSFFWLISSQDSQKQTSFFSLSLLECWYEAAIQGGLCVPMGGSSVGMGDGGGQREESEAAFLATHSPAVVWKGSCWELAAVVGEVRHLWDLTPDPMRTCAQQARPDCGFSHCQLSEVEGGVSSGYD